MVYNTFHATAYMFMVDYPNHSSMPRAELDFEFELLKELTEASGVPGYEEQIRKIVRRELEFSVDEIHRDRMGNVVGTIYGETDYTVVIAAHMDEIGFMVRHIDEEGFLELTPLGGWDPRVVRAQRVTVHTENDDLPGIIGSPPRHSITDGEEETLDIEDVRIDLGLDPEVVTEKVTVGDAVTMKQNTEFVGDHVTGKALDDRVCLLAMLEAAKRIDNPEVTVHFAATVQEEVGLRGARVLGFDLDPDLAIALDVTVANDITGFSEGENITELGDGAGIKVQDASVLTNPKVHQRMRDVAEERDIPYQLEVFPIGGTDTAGFQLSGGATAVGGISVPTRYMHTVTESAHCEDIEAVIDLLYAFIESETEDIDYAL